MYSGSIRIVCRPHHRLVGPGSKHQATIYTVRRLRWDRNQWDVRARGKGRRSDTNVPATLWSVNSPLYSRRVVIDQLLDNLIVRQEPFLASCGQGSAKWFDTGKQQSAPCTILHG